VNKLDALLQLMRTPDKGFSIVESSRKRKWQEGPDQDWNRDDDGDDEDMDGSAAAGTCDVVFEAECWKRARGYTSGFTSVRHQNSKEKFTMAPVARGDGGCDGGGDGAE